MVIQFRRAPFVLFRETPVENLMPNQLILHIQPEEGISLRFAAKVPGPVHALGAVDMNFEYADYFGSQPKHRLRASASRLHDWRRNALFQRADMVEAGWQVVSPHVDVWKALPPRIFPNYAAGSWGPKMRTNCSSAMAATGGTSRNDSGRRHWRHERQAGLFRCAATANSA